MRGPGRRAGSLALAAALLAAAPAAAYVLPASGILRRLSQKREQQALSSLEVQGTLVFAGEAAARAAEAGLPLLPGESSAPAFLTIKMPGRCRLELAFAETAPAERPAVIARAGRVAGGRGLERSAAAVALVQGLCALLGERPGGREPERPYAQALQALGVSLDDVALGRQGGRVAFVIGGRPRDDKPLAWIDKQTFQPVRLSAALGGARHEVRLVDWGSATGGDLFPRAVEVYAGGQLRLRFSTGKVLANPKVPDALF
jgi:hypothetical protein